MNNGWIKLHRSMLDWEWYSNPIVKVVFIHLLLSANHDEAKWMGETISRGQVVTGREELAKKLGFTEQNIRTALTKLKLTNEITIKSTNKYSVISINNYDTYQQDNQQPNQQLTNNQPTTNHKQEYKKDKKNKNNTYTTTDSLTETDFTEIATKYRVSIETVRNTYDSLTNWCTSKGKSYKNYKAALMNWIRMELNRNPNLKIRIVDNGAPELPELSDEDIARNLEKLRKMKDEILYKKHPTDKVVTDAEYFSAT